MSLRHAFTLLELLIAMAVAGVVLTVVAPSFDQLLLNGRQTARVNTLVTALHLARSEAIKRGRVVVVCPADRPVPDPGNCADTDADWQAGWLVFVNLDRDEPPRIDPDEPVLLRHTPVPGARIRANRRAFAYRPFGKNATNGTVVFCDRRGATAARAIIVSYTGRPRTSGRSASGEPLPCDD